MHVMLSASPSERGELRPEHTDRFLEAALEQGSEG